VPSPLLGAGNGTRTRDPKLGKLVLYHLSYARPLKILGGADGIRTRDLVNAIHALSHLSYSPTSFSILISLIPNVKLCEKSFLQGVCVEKLYFIVEILYTDQGIGENL